MKVDIIGKGNVGTHLSRAFGSRCDSLNVSSRDLEGLRRDSDLYLICVSDNAIEEVAQRVSSAVHRNAVIAHTSGSTPMSVLNGIIQPHGVFYPLQTFSKDVELNYREIPVFIEASDRDTEVLLKDCASIISDKVLTADSETRRDLHIASVFGCNFVNHLWTIADEYLKNKGLSLDLLMPLIKETTRKLERTSPKDAQTGPAVRRDTKTIEKHLDQLSDSPDLQQIYGILTDSIINYSK